MSLARVNPMNRSDRRCQQWRSDTCGVPVPLTCQAVIALDLGALHSSPLLLGQLGSGLVQQIDLGARRPVDNMHPFQLQKRPVVLAYRFPKFLLLVAAVALRLEVDGFLDLRLHLRFSRAGSIHAAASSVSSSGGRRQTPAAGLRVALKALYRVLFGFHISQRKRLERAMVLGHEGVFCWGGPDQRAVHKGCGMERQRRLGRRAAPERRRASKNNQENDFENVSGVWLVLGEQEKKETCRLLGVIN